MLTGLLHVLTQQSTCSAAGDQGELVSRIKSLELENQSLHKGVFACVLQLKEEFGILSSFFFVFFY